MKILAITVYAGSEKLVAMTERMFEQFMVCLDRLDTLEHSVEVIAVRNGAQREIDQVLADGHIFFAKNVGFAKAVNRAIETALTDHDAVLVMNNDLEFPDPKWLLELVSATDPKDFYVMSPCTDRTATHGARASWAMQVDPWRLGQISAFCWLVPARVIKMLKERWGFRLFDPDFFCYGEDDYTAAILRKTYGGAPFTVVPRAWVKHLKAQTGKELGMKGGMSKNVKLLKKKMQANKLR